MFATKHYSTRKETTRRRRLSHGRMPPRKLSISAISRGRNSTDPAIAGVEKCSMYKPIDIRSLRRAAGTHRGQTNERAISNDEATLIVSAAMTWEIPLANSLQVIMLARLAVGFADLTAGGMIDWLERELQYQVTRNAVRHNLRQLVEGGLVTKRDNTVSTGKRGPNLSTYDITAFGMRLLYIAKDLIDLRREQEDARHHEDGPNSAPTTQAGRT